MRGPAPRTLLLALAAAVCLASPGPAAADEHVVETAHYRLQYEGPRRDAEDAGRVLEAAWPRFREHFGAEPELGEGERLRLRFYGTREAWALGIRKDGTWPPRSAGGYYWPGTKTAHLYRQPTSYFTRVLLIHEAAHQFHYLTRTRNKRPGADWYTEGVAEYLSWHRWDGETLELGVVPGITLKDYPAAALAEVEARDFDLKPVVGGKRPASRALAWAIYSYLATGDDGKALPGFEAFRRKMDRGARPGGLVHRHLGSAKKLQAGLVAWLRAHQTTWAPGFNEWEEIGPGRMRGYARVVTACRVKEEAREIAASLEVPDRGWWRAGLLLHWTDKGDYTVALYDRRGRVQVNRRRDGRWERLHRGWVERRRGTGTHVLRAVRDGERVSFRIDGQEVGSWPLPGRSLGLSLERGDLRFRGVRWQ